MFKLALIQMRVDGGALTANLQRASDRVQRAAAAGANIALLPECMDLGWTDPSAPFLAGDVPGGDAYECLREMAVANQIYICGGLTERAEEKTFNSAVLIDPSGELKLLHRKLNELDIGHPYYAQGDRLGVFRSEFGTIGLMICADAFAKGQVLTRSLGYMGADIILSPCAWAVPPDHDNQKNPYGGLWDEHYMPICRDFDLWIAGVSNVGTLTGGPWSTWNCIGCSRVISPTGQPLEVMPYGRDADEIRIVEIETSARPARGCGWNDYWKSKATK